MKINVKANKMKKALLVKTKNEKEYLLHDKCLPRLIEFSKVFATEIYQVKVKESTELLSLGEFPKALCNPRYKIETKIKNQTQILPKSQIVTKEHQMPFPPPQVGLTRAERLARNTQIKNFITIGQMRGQGYQINKMPKNTYQFPVQVPPPNMTITGVNQVGNNTNITVTWNNHVPANPQPIPADMNDDAVFDILDLIFDDDIVTGN